MKRKMIIVCVTVAVLVLLAAGVWYAVSSRFVPPDAPAAGSFAGTILPDRSCIALGAEGDFAIISADSNGAVVDLVVREMGASPDALFLQAVNEQTISDLSAILSFREKLSVSKPLSLYVPIQAQADAALGLALSLGSNVSVRYLSHHDTGIVGDMAFYRADKKSQAMSLVFVRETGNILYAAQSYRRGSFSCVFMPVQETKKSGFQSTYLVCGDGSADGELVQSDLSENTPFVSFRALSWFADADEVGVYSVDWLYE